MATLVKQMPSPPQSNVPELLEELQKLWTKYLQLLDQYTGAQAQIAQLCSNGVFALATANHRNPHRTRYGSTHFDRRAQAATRYAITLDDDVGGFKTVLKTSLDSSSSTSPMSGKPSHKDEDSAKTGIDAEKTEQTQHAAVQPSLADEMGESSPAEKQGDADVATCPHDPLKWFGILVPQQLRTCQADFLRLTTDPVLVASNAARSMRQIEVAIGRLRKDIRKAERSSQA